MDRLLDEKRDMSRVEFSPGFPRTHQIPTSWLFEVILDDTELIQRCKIMCSFPIDGQITLIVQKLLGIIATSLRQVSLPGKLEARSEDKLASSRQSIL